MPPKHVAKLAESFDTLGSSKVSATFATALSSLPDRRNGMRFAVNAEALADAIKALLLDSETRKLFAKNARNSHDEKFSVEKVCEETMNLYTKIAKARSRD